MPKQVELTAQAVMEAQTSTINELQGRVIALSAAVNVLTAENERLEAELAELRKPAAEADPATNDLDVL